MLILTAETMLFFIFYQQMSTSLTLFALRNVDRNQTLFGCTCSPGPAQYQALNPIWIFMLARLLAWGYTRLGKKAGGDLPIAAKFAIGFAVVALGFFIYGMSGRFAHAGKVSSLGWWWATALIPRRAAGQRPGPGDDGALRARPMGGFMMGAYFVATGISQYLGSVVANYASVPAGVTSPAQSLPIYTNLFIKLGLVAVVGTVIAAALVPLMKRLPEAGAPEVAKAA